jgi:hypothetical protein
VENSCRLLANEVRKSLSEVDPVLPDGLLVRYALGDMPVARLNAWVKALSDL